MQDFVMEAYPDHIKARLEARERFATRPPGAGALEYVLASARLWRPGHRLTVAFYGGRPALHSRIAETAREWTRHGHLDMDFGEAGPAGPFRTWSPADRSFAADVRISFDEPGYWSLVGRDSADRAIVEPGESSMNFDGFAEQLPPDWAATVLHEFGHALGFHHEHQHPLGGCDASFRWDDDAGYRPTRDELGQYIPDAAGRRPGLYTLLGGPPNEWSRATVDHNLRQLRPSHAFQSGPFDLQSIMKYSFPAWMLHDGEQSPCFSRWNAVLSEADRQGMARAYPRSP
jgi:hypothetical protein